jgi:hypothetical protein
MPDILELMLTKDLPGKQLELPTVAEVLADKGPIPVRAVAHDAYRVSTK